MRVPGWVTQHVAALRALLVMTVLLGVVYPLVVTAVAQLPWLRDRAQGSLVLLDGKAVGSALIGQAWTDDEGRPLAQYFQSRPSMAGAGYDPDATSASNLGPESVVDTLPDPSVAGDTGTASLLSQVCSRSKAVGDLEGVDGRRPYCTSGGVGAVLAVFHASGSTGPATRVVSVNQACPAQPFVATYEGVRVVCATYGEDLSAAVTTPIRGDAPPVPVVPADAVTASGSGLDPGISPAYAALQVPRVAKARGVSPEAVATLVGRYTTGRALGFLGEPVVDVLGLDLALDRQFPYGG